MKASSANLETDIYLTQEEIKKLEHSALDGNIAFREYEDNGAGRKIPFRIIHDKLQNDFLNVKIIPQKTYFGDAEKIMFTINSEFYNNLSNYGEYGARFLGSGKLLIFAENIK